MARATELPGDPWTLMVVREAFLGTRRFNFTARIKQQWGELTDDEIRQAEGNMDELSARIQENTATARKRLPKKSTKRLKMPAIRWKTPPMTSKTQRTAIKLVDRRGSRDNGLRWRTNS